MPFQPHDPSYISVSQINNYSGGYGCPARYFFGYVLRLRSRFVGSSLAIGSGLGRAIQTPLPKGCTDSLPVWFDAWEDYVHSVWDELDPDVDRDAMLSKGKDMLRALAKVGVRVSGIPEFEVKGAILNCPDTGEELPPLIAYLDWYDPICHHIVEFKTSASIKRWSTHLVQLAVYRYVTTKIGPSGERIPPTVELLQVNRGKSPRVHSETIFGLNDKKENWVLRSVAQTVRAIRAGHFPTRPSYACNSCDFRAACQDDDFSGLQEKY